MGWGLRPDTSRRSAWRARAFAIVALGGAAIALLSADACVPDRPASCRTPSDCQSGICNLQGFCESECTQDRDCPCGAHCATVCGLCVRDDGLGPATCFAFERGLTTDLVLGTCRVDGGVLVPDAASVGDGGVCQSPPPTLPSCVASPPISDAGSVDASGDGAEGGDAPSDGAISEGGDAGDGAPDASVDGTGD
jgi:hypothetical protein